MPTAEQSSRPSSRSSYRGSRALRLRERLRGLTLEDPTAKAELERILDEETFIRVRLDRVMAAWLEDLVSDERYELVREMKENRIDGRDDPVRLSEVRIAEKVMTYMRGAMDEMGWRD